MKEKTNKSLAKITKKIATSVAIYYANVACPFLTYQPKISDEVKKLRRF